MKKKNTKKKKDGFLLIFRNGNTKDIYPLDLNENSVRIGRHSDCNIQIPNITVSRKQVEIQKENNNIIINPISNITILNSKKLEKATILKDNDIFEISNHKFQFVLDSKEKDSVNNNVIEEILPRKKKNQKKYPVTPYPEVEQPYGRMNTQINNKPSMNFTPFAQPLKEPSSAGNTPFYPTKKFFSPLEESKSNRESFPKEDLTLTGVKLFFNSEKPKKLKRKRENNDEEEGNKKKKQKI